MKHLISAAVLANSVAVMSVGAHAETVLIANDPGPNRGVRAEAVNHFSELLAVATDGAVRVENNWGGALFATTAAVDSIGLGVADMGVVVGPYAQSEMPELNIGGQPMQPAGPWVMMKALDDLFSNNAQIRERMAENGLVYLNAYSLPPSLLACNDDLIRTTDDVAGVRISNTGTTSELFDRFDGNMVDMPIYEVYQSMQTGLIDCTVTFSYFAVATQLHELLATMAPLDLPATTVVLTVMNRDTFESLSPETQAGVLEAASSMADYYGQQLEHADAVALEAMRAAGVQDHAFTADEQQAMQVAMQPNLDEWLADAEASGLDGQAVYDEFLGYVETWQAVLDAQGFPWVSN
ncbi:MAG: C4-dicarboxylate TRAP transporter substrate-binding protein [Pseudomonadota bacterium]